MPPPDDLSLEPVDHDPFAAGQFSSADIASMTHQAPDTSAKPAFDAAFGTLHAFLTGGLQGVANLRGANTPDWSKNLGAVLSSPEANAALGMTVPLGKGITAFHGSPHDFDAFDMSKIGTGEGAQAYGHGLYFAENPAVAEDYKGSLSRTRPWEWNGKQITPTTSTDDVPYSVRSAVQWLEGNQRPGESVDALVTRRIKDLSDHAEFMRNSSNPADKYSAGMYDSAVEQLRGLDTSKLKAPTGKMYQVSINADPEHFLDWDKPLSDQHPKVQEAIQNRVSQLTADEPGPRRGGKHILQSQVEQDATGGDIYGRLAYKQGAFPEIGVQDHAAATQALRAAGIPGIKYLDQGSRNTLPAAEISDRMAKANADRDYLNKMMADPQLSKADQGVYKGQLMDINDQIDRLQKMVPAETATHNYVVFDDKLISIMKKYGIAGIGALPGLGAYHFQTDAVDHDPFAGQ